ncbi:MAG: hypothetical protein QM778_06260 [Myxococcales bacterium]
MPSPKHGPKPPARYAAPGQGEGRLLVAVGSGFLGEGIYLKGQLNDYQCPYGQTCERDNSQGRPQLIIGSVTMLASIVVGAILTTKRDQAFARAMKTFSLDAPRRDVSQVK